jgi:hypothetical protein
VKSPHYLPVLVAEWAEELMPEHGRDEGQEVLVGLSYGSSGFLAIILVTRRRFP